MEDEKKSSAKTVDDWAVASEAETAAVSASDKPMSCKQNEMFTKLNDMFGEVLSSESILAACNLLKWELDDCVEALIRLALYADTSTCSTIPQDSVGETGQQKRSAELLEKDFESAAETQISEFSMGPGMRHLGAIPKGTTKSKNPDSKQNNNNRSFSCFNPDAQPFVQRPKLSNQNSRSSIGVKPLEQVLKKIRAGYKVMVLMRGPPGCGKSYLARQIVEKTVGSTEYRDHIFSTDDYFCDSNGNYVFRPDDLSLAHESNQKKVRNQAVNGWSPIIVDNTNIKLWEMYVYVGIAVENGYLIEIVEPRTHWSKSAGKLAAKNRHGVPRERIQRMLDNYEPATMVQLMQICKCKYTVPVPQFRLSPPRVAVETTVAKSDERTALINAEEGSENQSDDDVFMANENANETEDDGNDIVFSSDGQDDWKSYEEESKEFWKEKQDEDGLGEMVNNLPKPPRKMNLRKNEPDFRKPTTDHDITDSIPTGENISTINSSSTSEQHKIKQSSESQVLAGDLAKDIERHEIDCENENQNFVMLRQIYPNKQIDGLWDLFEKCQGNIDWTVDILLKDDSCVDRQYETTSVSAFHCDCKQEATSFTPNEIAASEMNDLMKEFAKNANTPKRQRVKREKSTKTVDELQDIKKTIESQFVLGDKHYSTNLKRIRDMRHGLVKNNGNDRESNTEQPTEGEDSSAPMEPKEPDDGSSDNEDDPMVEVNMGEKLIEQLSGIFDLDLIPKNMIKDLKTSVFIPKSLAYQLYLTWVESVYNQVEEQKYKTLQEDEELARMMSLEQDKKETKGAKDLEEELVTHLYNSERNCWDTNNSEDLASHLTKLKLAEQFPDVGQQTLLETLGAQQNRYEDTVQILQSIQFWKDVMEPNERKEQKTANTDVSALEEIPLDSTFAVENNLNSDEAKKLALHHFEMNRNMAVHHSQLKAECYQKAKEAIQKGNTAVAVYYSQIADFHKQKVDTFNHAAANYIVAAHDFTQNNPDFIDLHYLHLAEAEQCLDIFLDKHIRKLKNINKNHKYVFIITGRGLHSLGGVSIIKNKVKSRLKDRNLKWSELNPGLLKVKVFSNSRFVTITNT